MYYIGLDVHKKTISYCVKDASGQIHRQGTIGATRNELDWWVKTLPQPWMVAMEATMFSGWIYGVLPASLRKASRIRVSFESGGGGRRFGRSEGDVQSRIC
jgi:hypothetical protein